MALTGTARTLYADFHKYVEDAFHIRKCKHMRLMFMQQAQHARAQERQQSAHRYEEFWELGIGQAHLRQTSRIVARRKKYAVPLQLFIASFVNCVTELIAICYAVFFSCIFRWYYCCSQRTQSSYSKHELPAMRPPPASIITVARTPP